MFKNLPTYEKWIKNSCADPYSLKSAQAWDIRRQVFYIIQACMVGDLNNPSKMLKLFWFGLIFCIFLQKTHAETNC